MKVNMLINLESSILAKHVSRGQSEVECEKIFTSCSTIFMHLGFINSISCFCC